MGGHLRRRQPAHIPCTLNIYDMNITLDRLNEFGKVEQAEIKDDRLHVKITTGFKNNAGATFGLIGEISKAHPEFVHMEKCVTKENLFHLTLKP